MSRGRRIARIKLVPPSPAAAQKFLLEWNNRDLYHTPEKFPQLTAQNLFSKDGAMVLEIGSGTGEFLIAQAQAHPDQAFVGVEISKRAAYHAVNQADKGAVENCIFIKADIRLLYPRMAPASWSQVHLNYPDPNYAAGRRKHRIFNPEFLDVFHRSLTGAGTIRVVTDQRPFLLDMLAIAESDSRFEKSHTPRFLEGPAPEHMSRFQKAWERQKRPFFHFELQKTRKIP